ncbi:MAG: TetR family transcriptional regulator, partial [Anaerotardibacter sp.]
MAALDTKLLIADAFVELCEENGLRKVSISDVVAKTGKNRKTFYYHFVDKESLIIWKFRYDLG